MTVSGDFKRLGQLSAALRTASRRAQKDVLRVFAADVAFRVDQCFQRSQSPYGERWRPLEHPSGRRRGGMPLLDTGRLRNSIRVRSSGDRIQVSSNVVYAGIHNYGGTVKHSARTELRRYATYGSGQSKRRRIGLYSRAKRSVRTAADVGAFSGTIPRRQFLPDEGRGLPLAWVVLLRRRADQVQRELGLTR